MLPTSMNHIDLINAIDHALNETEKFVSDFDNYHVDEDSVFCSTKKY